MVFAVGIIGDDGINGFIGPFLVAQFMLDKFVSGNSDLLGFKGTDATRGVPAAEIFGVPVNFVGPLLMLTLGGRLDNGVTGIPKQRKIIVIKVNPRP